MLPAPRCQVMPERNTSPPSYQETNTVSIGSGTAKGSPYISVSAISTHSPRPSRDRMAAVDHPDPLALARLAPFQRAGRAHQPLEDLREVAGMQDDQPHAFPDAALHPLDDLVLDLAMRGVAPPQQHVGLGEPRLGQPVLGLLQRRGRRLDRLVLAAAPRRSSRACRPDRSRARPRWSARGHSRPRPRVRIVIIILQSALGYDSIRTVSRRKLRSRIRSIRVNFRMNAASA